MIQKKGTLRLCIYTHHNECQVNILPLLFQAIFSSEYTDGIIYCTKKIIQNMNVKDKLY